MADFYDWEKTLSYDAPITGVFGARDIGKTFGLREQMLRDYFKDGYNHVEICRYAKQVPRVCAGYFDKVARDTRDENLKKKLYGARFRYQGREAFIGFPDGDKKYKWDKILSVVALTESQDLKKQTFSHVRRVVMDEAILEANDRYHDYLPNEYAKLANLMDTIARQQPGEKTDVRLYLLGNAVDLINPYFAHFGIDEAPAFGYRWYAGKLFLLHYPDPGGYGQKKLDTTLAGRMIKGTSEEASTAFNRFSNDSKTFIAKKPPRAKFTFGVVYRGESFGVWCDYDGGRYYVNKKIVETGGPVFALSTEDHKPNYIVAKRANPMLKRFSEFYCLGVVYFDKASTRERFNDVLALFGVH